MASEPTPFWTLSLEALLHDLQTMDEGLSEEEVRRRLDAIGFEQFPGRKGSSDLGLLLGQFKNPLVLILLSAAGLSYFLHDPIDALIILGIVLISGLLGFWQERGAAQAVKKLLAMVQVRTVVLRAGKQRVVPAAEIVAGDILLLSAGAAIPGDCRLLESNDLFVNEAPLTGETYPVEKLPGVLDPDTPLAQRSNVLFLGTNVVSGSALAVVVRIGRQTEFGKISERLRLRPPETEFERGIRRFGNLLAELTLVLVVIIFSINVFLARPVLETFLFALALAVGLTPQLLPAIISINLAHGARRMAQGKVIVKRLSAIENLGSMDVLCSDKTGTLTEGVVELAGSYDAEGKESRRVLFYAWLNAFLETGFINPIDEAIRRQHGLVAAGYEKAGEIPYDFVRKRLSVAVRADSEQLLITKGALNNVLEVCTGVETRDGRIVGLDGFRTGIEQLYREFSIQGVRTLGVACRRLDADEVIDKDLEQEMTFLGFLTFHDPPKKDVAAVVAAFRELGVTLKVITGDNQLVAAAIAPQVGLPEPRILTGPELRQMSDEALLRQVVKVDVFAEVEPNQKERILLALKKAGHVVGYMGDGINDASALHAADVGLSVDGAVDVAKEAADIVLLEKDLEVLVQGVREGRMTFVNTMKYVFMATSANFGNMFSMAGVSLFLSFLPMLPKQVLLTNLLTDFPEMAIATDGVDLEMILRPRRWDIRFIRKFMFAFGLLSSLFDFLTFAVLLFVLRAGTGQFRTGWFTESVVSASLVVLIIRTRRPFFRSRPGRYLLLATVLILGLTLALPFGPLAPVFGFEPLPVFFLLLLGGIVLLYALAAEVVKRIFYRRAGE